MVRLQYVFYIVRPICYIIIIKRKSGRTSKVTDQFQNVERLWWVLWKRLWVKSMSSLVNIIRVLAKESDQRGVKWIRVKIRQRLRTGSVSYTLPVLCYGDEENARIYAVHLTTANQSEIRRAYLVSVAGRRIFEWKDRIPSLFGRKKTFKK